MRIATIWRENPKSHTVQEKARQEKKHAAEKEKKKVAEEKKGKHGKKCTVGQAFTDEAASKPEVIEEEMFLLSDLAEVPTFISRVVDE